MGRPSQRKSERHRKRQAKRDTNDRNYRRRVELVDRFPSIYYKENGAPREFVDAVKLVFRKIVRQYDTLLPPTTTILYQSIKRKGFAATSAWLSEKLSGNENPVWIDFFFALGDKMISMLPPAIRESFLPYNYAIVRLGLPRDTEILVEFKSLKSHRVKGGTAYHSPYHPVVHLGDEDYIVAFSRHALERICERTVGDWTRYGGLANAFRLFHDCVYFEPWITTENEPEFALFRHCYCGTFSFQYVTEILTTPDPNERNYYYRVGYCPVTLEDGFAVAKTLLLPGMRGTPEYDRVVRHMARSYESRQELRKIIGRLTLGDLVERPDFSMLRRFHESGIPQVVRFTHKVFRDPDE